MKLNKYYGGWRHAAGCSMKWVWLALVLAGCGVPASVGAPLFTTAAIAGAGAAFGAGGVSEAWSHLPFTVSTPSAAPTPLAEKP